MRRRGAQGRASREQQAESIKESIYLTFAMLAVLITLLAHGEVSAFDALRTLAVTTVSMALAILAADLLSHLVVHDRLMSFSQTRHAVRASFGSLATFVAPALLLGVGVVGVWSAEQALWAAILALSGTLVVVAGLAVRGTPILWWQRLLGVLAIAAVVTGVIAVEMLAHG